MDINSKTNKGQGEKSLLNKIHKGQWGKQITAGVMDITIKVHEGQRKKRKSLQEWWTLLKFKKFTKDSGENKSLLEWWILLLKFMKDRGEKKSLQEWWRLLLKFTKDRGKKITAGVMAITCKGGRGAGWVESLQEWWILPVKFTEGEVSKLVFYAQSTSVVISGRSEVENNHSMDITCKEGRKKKSLQEWWISRVKFTKDLTGTVVAANLCLWELLQVNQPALHRIHSQGIVCLVLLQLCTKTQHAAIIHWTHFIIVLISQLASLPCWPQLSRPPCLFATLEQISLPLCHSCHTYTHAHTHVHTHSFIVLHVFCFLFLQPVKHTNCWFRFQYLLILSCKIVEFTRWPQPVSWHTIHEAVPAAPWSSALRSLKLTF